MIECQTPNDASATQLLHLSLTEYCGRVPGRTVRARGLESCFEMSSDVFHIWEGSWTKESQQYGCPYRVCIMTT